MREQADQSTDDVAEWWSTSIIEMKPGIIRYRGHPIETLIGEISFTQMIWLLTRGVIPDPKEADLLESVLVSAVDHGPQAPSIAAARMAATCGISLNNVLATGVNMLGDVHGGAGAQAVELYESIEMKLEEEPSLESSVKNILEKWATNKGKHIPGFGHRFHKTMDPRAPKLLQLVDRAAKDGVVSGNFAAIGREIEKQLKRGNGGRPIPMNIDGATAVVLAELKFPSALARGIFCLSRSVGILAHAWEQMQQGGRNKGPTPPEYGWKYTGPTNAD